MAGVPVVGDSVEIHVGRTEQHVRARGQGHLFQFDRQQVPVVLRRVQMAKHAGALKKNKGRFRGLNSETAVYETKSWHYFQTQAYISLVAGPSSKAVSPRRRGREHELGTCKSVFTRSMVLWPIMAAVEKRPRQKAQTTNNGQE